jgi:hypothetical protein
MPLSAPGLQSDLESLFASPPATVAECGQAWADAVGAYASGVVPASTTVSAAQATLAGALASAFGTEDAASPMDAAFQAFATTVGTGMAPAFVATPPPSPVGFATLFAPPFPETHAAAAQKYATAIDTWARTGTATPSGGGAPVPWS